jgi:hypothetical protein
VKSLRRASVLLCLHLCLLNWITPASASGNKPKKPNMARDSVTVQADAVPLQGVSGDTIEKTLNGESAGNQIKWSDVYTNWRLDSIKNSLPSCVGSAADKDQAYIFHIVHWKIGDTGKPPQLVSSSWSVYGSNRTKNPDAMKRRLDSTGNPLIYGKRRILLVGVNVFDNGRNGASTLTIQYKSSVTQGTPENVQALGQLITSLAGLSAAAKAATGQILIAFACQERTAHLPFDANIVETIGLPKKTSTDTNQPQQPTGQGATPITPPAVPEQTPVPDKPESPQGSNSSSGLEDHALSGHVSYVQVRSGSPRGFGQTKPQNPSEGAQTSGVPADASSRWAGNHEQQGGQPQDNANGAQQGGQPQDNTNGTSQKKTSPQSGQADCSGLSDKNNCTISRTLTSVDKEWWDVSLAQTVVGVKESKFSISGSSLISKPTTHNDLYALFDVYPWAKWVTKDSGIPHFTAGLPVAGQTLYRPSAGMAINVTGWTHLERLGFPVKMSLFANIVNMKITRVTRMPTTAAQLAADSKTARVWKPIYGIEVPVSALISKVGKGSQSKTTNGGKGTAGTPTNQGSTATQ